MSEYIYVSSGEPLANSDNEISLARKEIVQCKDCMYYTGYGVEYYCCSYWCGQVEPDGFCAWGKKKEGGE